MSEPTGDPGETKPTPADVKPKAKPPALLSVGHFPHRDGLLGGVHDRHGVVVEVGDALTVIPLERYTVSVDPADFTPLSADDLT